LTLTVRSCIHDVHFSLSIDFQKPTIRLLYHSCALEIA
jgi:hypothetical protein